MTFARAFVAALLVVVLGACASDPADPTVAAPSTTAATGAVTTGAAGAPVTATDETAIPLGDGQVTTSAQVGAVFSCQTTFNGGGAVADVPWIHDTTWSLDEKLAVQGDVAWPEAAFSSTLDGDRRVITTNDLPTGHNTGTFPIAASDPAYQYDRNPNSISARSVTLDLPATPTAASSPACVSLGAIGILNDGVYLFNALDAAGRDAAAHEVLDRCDGHPERSGAYHHHTVPRCVVSAATGPSTLVGYALDGFGVFVDRHDDGTLLTNAELDECHGRTSEITWDGAAVSMYHYVATVEYPYTIGCYRGTPVAAPQ